MIVEFSIENFGPIKEKQTLSFLARNSQHLEEQYIINVNELRLLKIALLFGPNASGKTYILYALDFLRKIVLEPKIRKDENIEYGIYNPFLFDKKAAKSHSKLSLQFIANDIKYNYYVEFTRSAIVSEELYRYTHKKTLVYNRTTNLKNQTTQITFGSKIQNSKDQQKMLEINTLWNNTVLGGYVKSNIHIPDLKNVIDWFNDTLAPIITPKTDLTGFVSRLLDKNKIQKKDILRILAKADLQISDIQFEKDEREKPVRILLSEFNAPNENDDRIEELVKQKKVKVVYVKTLFNHQTKQGKFFLPIEYESRGTIRFYGLTGILTLMIKKTSVFLIDELESSLHPDLFIHFILSFLENTKKSQLIVTTHFRELLDNRDIFRNDVIWFTDKDTLGSTHLYSLDDFDSSVVRNTTNVLNAYKSGRLGAIPNLGDYFL